MKDRKELFLKWWFQSLYINDCDTNLYAAEYVIDRMELNREQRYWLAFLHANTYQLPTAWVLFNEFPDYDGVCVERMREWNEVNKSRLPYQKDQKWLRGKLARIYESYHSTVGPSQREFFALLDNDFDAAWTTCTKQFFMFGRYTTWFYLQSLNSLCGHEFVAPRLYLESDSSAAPRAGLAYACGKDDWAEADEGWTQAHFDYLERAADELLAEAQRRFGKKIRSVHVDRFSMETALCSFKKLFRRKQGRYLGYYLDRYAEDINKTAAQGWDGINWRLLWESRDDVLLPEFNCAGVDPKKMEWFLDEGVWAKGARAEELDLRFERATMNVLLA